MKNTENLVIVGSGPAGLTAAIYAGRAGLSPAVIEGLQPGGQLTQTTDIENFPGFPQGIDGFTLMAAMREQAERCGARFIAEEVINIIPQGSTGLLTCDQNTKNTGQKTCATFHTLELSMGERLETKTVIIATGASARWLGLATEKAFIGKGLSACATCDGAFYKGQDVAVVGGGDTAMEDALYLARLCRSVTVIHRRDAFRASKAMADRVLTHPAITVKWNRTVKDLHVGADGFLNRITLSDVASETTESLDITGLFVAIGHAPNTKAFANVLATDDDGFLLVDDRRRTNVPGIFAAGDVADRHYKQAIAAAGTGCAAALEAERYLATLTTNQ